VCVKGIIIQSIPMAFAIGISRLNTIFLRQCIKVVRYIFFSWAFALNPEVLWLYKFFSDLSMYNTINLHSAMQRKEEEKDPLVMSFHMDVSLFVYPNL
jgi:hypothetical protein